MVNERRKQLLRFLFAQFSRIGVELDGEGKGAEEADLLVVALQESICNFPTLGRPLEDTKCGLGLGNLLCLTRFVYGLYQALNLLIGQRKRTVARHVETG